MQPTDLKTPPEVVPSKVPTKVAFLFADLSWKKGIVRVVIKYLQSMRKHLESQFHSGYSMKHEFYNEVYHN